MLQRLNPIVLVILIVPGIVLVAGFLLLGWRSVQGYTPEVGATAAAMLASPDGETLGVVMFTQLDAGVLVAADAKGLPPGGHAFTIHEIGACTPDFAAAGDHFNPGDARRGLIHPNWKPGRSVGAHGGDLPNIYAAADGTARADFFTDAISLGAGADHSVFDANGSAIIIHEKPGTYAEEESDTGARLACGVIRRS